MHVPVNYQKREHLQTFQLSNSTFAHKPKLFLSVST